MPGHAQSDMLIKFVSSCVTGEALFSEILLDHHLGIRKSIIELLDLDPLYDKIPDWNKCKT